MSIEIDYQNIYHRIQDLYQDLIFELGKCYINNRSHEKVLISFLKNLDFIIYPNTVFTDENISIMEIKNEEIN